MARAIRGKDHEAPIRTERRVRVPVLRRVNLPLAGIHEATLGLCLLEALKEGLGACILQT